MLIRRVKRAEKKDIETQRKELQYVTLERERLCAELARLEKQMNELAASVTDHVTTSDIIHALHESEHKRE